MPRSSHESERHPSASTLTGIAVAVAAIPLLVIALRRYGNRETVDMLRERAQSGADALRHQAEHADHLLRRHAGEDAAYALRHPVKAARRTWQGKPIRPSRWARLIER